MEKIFESIIDEITNRVLKKLEDNTSNMHNFLNLKIKAENIEDLQEHLEEWVRNQAEDVAGDMIRNASFTVDVSL